MAQETRPILLRVSDHEKEGVGNRREGKKRAGSSDDNYGDDISMPLTKKPQYGEAHRG